MGNNKKRRKATNLSYRNRRDVKDLDTPATPKTGRAKDGPEVASEKVIPYPDVKVEGASSIAQREVKTWRSKLFLEGKYVATWGIIITAIGILVAVITFVYSYKTSWDIQARNEERATSKIIYFFTITPAPIPGEEDFRTTSRWEVKMMIGNAGPSTAQNLVLHLRTPDPNIFLHSEPRIMTPPATADIKVNKFIPEGIYQVVFKNFGSGDTCYLNMYYRTSEDKRTEFQENWSLFDEKFGKRFIQDFFFTGDRLKIENFGTMNLRPSSGDIVE
jgi:hypothetical protein